MEATLAFYRKLGLQIPDTAVWRTESGAHHVDVSMPNGIDLDCDGAQLARSYNAGWTPDAASRSVIGFSLPTREAVDAGGGFPSCLNFDLERAGGGAAAERRVRWAAAGARS